MSDFSRLKIKGQISLLAETVDCPVDQKSVLREHPLWDFIPSLSWGEKNQVFLNTQEETFSADLIGACWKNSSCTTDQYPTAFLGQLLHPQLIPRVGHHNGMKIRSHCTLTILDDKQRGHFHHELSKSTRASSTSCVLTCLTF